MKRITLIIVLGVALIAGIPQVSRAQSEKNVQDDLMNLAAQAETTTAQLIPPGVKKTANTFFARLETFRLQQVSWSTAHRDALRERIVDQQARQETLTEENRDRVLDGESASLYTGMGTRFAEGVSVGDKVSYYAYSVYAYWVSSPIFFYVIGALLIVYILTTLFRRFRRSSSSY